MADWEDRLLRKLKRAIEGLDDDQVQEAVNDNLDLGDLIQDIMTEDEEVKAAIKAKVKTGLLKFIEGWDPNNDNTFDDVNLSEMATEIMKEDEEVKAAIKAKVKTGLLEFIGSWDPKDDNVFDDLGLGDLAKELVDEDEEVKAAIKAKLREVLLKEIKNITDISDLDSSGDFTFSDCLPADFVSDTVTEMLKSDDPGDKDSPLAKVRQIIRDALGDLERDDVISDWSDFVNSLDLDEVIKRVIAEETLKRALEDNVAEAIKSKFDDLSSDDLPSDFWDLVDLSTRIREVATRSDFEQTLRPLVSAAIEGHLRTALEEGDDKLLGVVTSNQRVQTAISDAVSDLLRDADFYRRLKETLQRELDRQSRDGGGLLNALIGKLSEMLIGRLFSDRRP